MRRLLKLLARLSTQPQSSGIELTVKARLRPETTTTIPVGKGFGHRGYLPPTQDPMKRGY